MPWIPEIYSKEEILEEVFGSASNKFSNSSLQSCKTVDLKLFDLRIPLQSEKLFRISALSQFFKIIKDSREVFCLCGLYLSILTLLEMKTEILSDLVHLK